MGQPKPEALGRLGLAVLALPCFGIRGFVLGSKILEGLWMGGGMIIAVMHLPRIRQPLPKHISREASIVLRNRTS